MTKAPNGRHITGRRNKYRTFGARINDRHLSRGFRPGLSTDAPLGLQQDGESPMSKAKDLMGKSGIAGPASVPQAPKVVTNAHHEDEHKHKTSQGPSAPRAGQAQGGGGKAIGRRPKV